MNILSKLNTIHYTTTRFAAGEFRTSPVISRLVSGIYTKNSWPFPSWFIWRVHKALHGCLPHIQIISFFADYTTKILSFLTLIILLLLMNALPALLVWRSIEFSVDVWLTEKSECIHKDIVAATFRELCSKYSDYTTSTQMNPKQK